VHPTIEQIWRCKGAPRLPVFNRWRHELWDQVAPMLERLETVERENERLRALVAAQAQPVRRKRGRPRKHPQPEVTA
jgi:hypothetical protein